MSLLHNPYVRTVGNDVHLYSDQDQVFSSFKILVVVNYYSLLSKKLLAILHALDFLIL